MLQFRDSPAESRQACANVTIVIACYDQGRFLKQAIASCVEQLLLPREVIVVDDGSHDDTREVAERFEQVRYVYQANQGLSSARNAGLALATSSRIMFLDADDWLTPTALQAATRAFETQPRSPAFVYGSYHEVAENGDVLATSIARPRADVFQDLLRGNFIAMHGTVLYDTALLAASGGFDTALRSCEDFDVYLRLARDHPVGAYPEVGACYRRHGESLSCDRITMIATATGVLDRHLHLGGRSRTNLAAAREGRAAMTNYYAQKLAADIRQGRARAVRRVLRSMIRRPRVTAQLLRWAIGRWTRAVTITG